MSREECINELLKISKEEYIIELLKKCVSYDKIECMPIYMYCAYNIIIKYRGFNFTYTICEDDFKKYEPHIIVEFIIEAYKNASIDYSNK